MTQGETPDAKSKRMHREVPQRIKDTADAARAVYDVVKPASDQRKPARKRPADE